MLTSRREIIRWALMAPAAGSSAIAAQSAAAGKPPRLRITDIESFSVAVKGDGTTDDPVMQLLVFQRTAELPGHPSWDVHEKFWNAG